MRGYRGGIIFVFLCRHFQQEAVNANLGYRYKQSFVGFVEVDGLVGWFSFSCKPLLWVLLLFCRVCGLEQPGFTEPSREEEARLHPWADRNWGKICGRFADSAGGNFTQICWIIHVKAKSSVLKNHTKKSYTLQFLRCCVCELGLGVFCNICGFFLCLCRFSASPCLRRAGWMSQRWAWFLSTGRNCWPATQNLSSKYLVGREEATVFLIAWGNAVKSVCADFFQCKKACWGFVLCMCAGRSAFVRRRVERTIQWGWLEISWLPSCPTCSPTSVSAHPSSTAPHCCRLALTMIQTLRTSWG